MWKTPRYMALIGENSEALSFGESYTVFQLKLHRYYHFDKWG